MSDVLIDVQNLKQYFPIRTGLFSTTPLKAVDDVSFYINRGETLGLVGESGCGKTTVGRSLLRLYKPTAGHVFYEGTEITERNIHEYRKKMQMVFQDPYSSLNPRMTVADIIGEPLDVHKVYANKKDRNNRIAELMSLVGLNSEHARRYAHEFSGGQRQRIGIARALYYDPEILFFDEATSSLDNETEAAVMESVNALGSRKTMIIVAHRLTTLHGCDQIYRVDEAGVKETRFEL